jgi:hypothetical protein
VIHTQLVPQRGERAKKPPSRARPVRSRFAFVTSAVRQTFAKLTPQHV